MWEEILRIQQCNFDYCLTEKNTQLSKKTMKLTLMDVDSCTKFSELSNILLKRSNQNSTIWKSSLYEDCDKFIEVARKLDYSYIPLEHIPVLIESHLMLSFIMLAHCLLMLDVLNFIILLVGL